MSVYEQESHNGIDIYLKAAFIIMIVARIVATNQGWLLLMVRCLTK